MFYAISWILCLALVALWSLACWGLHTVTVWAVSGAGALAGGTSAIHTGLVPEWIKGWIPPELTQQFEALIASTGPLLQGLLEAIPALAGAVTVLAWGVWGLGTFVLLALAAGVHVLITLWRSRENGMTLATQAPAR